MQFIYNPISSNLYTIHSIMKLHSLSTTSVQIWTDACVLFSNHKVPHKAGIGIFIQAGKEQFAISSPLDNLNPINSTNAELCAIQRSFQIIHTNRFRNSDIWTDSQHAVTLCQKWAKPSFNHSISRMHQQIKLLKHPFMVPIYYLYTQLLRDGIQIQISHINTYHSITHNINTHLSPTHNSQHHHHRIAHNLARKGAEQSDPCHLRKK